MLPLKRIIVPRPFDAQTVAAASKERAAIFDGQVRVCSSGATFAPGGVMRRAPVWRDGRREGVAHER